MVVLSAAHTPLVIVTTSSFASAAQPLKVRRESEGLRTTIVDVEDLYDEFGFGEHGPSGLSGILDGYRR